MKKSIDKNDTVLTLIINESKWYKQISSGLDILFNTGTYVCIFEFDESFFIVWQDDICYITQQDYIEFLLSNNTEMTYEEYLNNYKKKSEKFVISDIIDITQPSDSPLSRLAALGVRFS